MYGLIEDIVIFSLVFYVLKTILRFVLPTLVKMFVNNSQKGNGFPNGANPYGEQTQKDGKIKINYVPPKKPEKIKPEEGTFIDYEEIKK